MYNYKCFSDKNDVNSLLAVGFISISDTDADLLLPIVANKKGYAFYPNIDSNPEGANEKAIAYFCYDAQRQGILINKTKDDIKLTCEYFSVPSLTFDDHQELIPSYYCHSCYYIPQGTTYLESDYLGNLEFEGVNSDMFILIGNVTAKLSTDYVEFITDISDLSKYSYLPSTIRQNLLNRVVDTRLIKDNILKNAVDEWSVESSTAFLPIEVFLNIGEVRVDYNLNGEAQAFICNGYRSIQQNYINSEKFIYV